MSAETLSPPALIELQGVTKQYAGNPVLKGVDLSLARGEIFALVGGNGAGKSTLMKMITGLQEPDHGTIAVEGTPVFIRTPRDAHRLGIYLIPQEPLIFPHMTVEENILIGMNEKTSILRGKLQVLMNQLGWNLSLHQTAGSLSIAEQQLLEIVRGLIREARILILDEPTSTLTFAEIRSLFQLLRSLADKGIGLFYITHRFSEIFELAHTVAILRDGTIALHGPVQAFTYEDLLEGLLPPGALPSRSTDTGSPSPYQNNPPSEHSASMHPLPHSNISDSRSDPVLRIRDLSGKGFSNISIEVYEGEVLGIAGVVGAGRTELAEAIFGINAWEKGDVLLHGRSIQRMSIRQRMNAGLAYVPEDRYAHGIFSMAGLQQNISSAILHRLSKWLLPVRKESKMAGRYIADLHIHCRDHAQPIRSLSGGNQQKAVLAKYLAANPRLIILDEPTRGIDANARQDIYRIINRLREEGLGVILISSDMEEIVQLSDRVMVMHEGCTSALFQHSDVSVDRIATAAFGVKKGG